MIYFTLPFTNLSTNFQSLCSLRLNIAISLSICRAYLLGQWPQAHDQHDVFSSSALPATAFNKVNSYIKK